MPYPISSGFRLSRRSVTRCTVLLLLLLCSTPVFAYVGPGAGFAVVGSFAAIAAAVVISIASLLLWPFIWLLRAPRRLLAMRRAKYRKVVVLGLDGTSPAVLKSMMDAGELPNFQAVKEAGYFGPLRTSVPPISPVAWSVFQTGSNPGKTNIFDFLSRAPGSYQPRLSFSEVMETTTRRGRKKSTARILRQSTPFWALFGRAGIPASSLRVPVSFPCDRFKGLCLAAMGAPDLRGTQGSSTVVSSQVSAAESRGDTLWVPAVSQGTGKWRFELPGPNGTDGKPMTAAMTLSAGRNGAWRIGFPRTRVDLPPGVFSEWVPVLFKGNGKPVGGQVQFLLRSADPLHLYISPVNIDPQKPAIPVSWPVSLSYYLSRRLGRFSTLGICEDMSGVKDGALTREEYLAQVYNVHEERKSQWKHLLRIQRQGLVCGVFDLPDRVQHIFWANGGDVPEIKQMYRELDALVGETKKLLGPKSLLLILSDHGFCSFRHAVELNGWLMENGYLVLRDGKVSPAVQADIDWSRTKAYAFGLAGVYLNVKGREPQGSVDPGQAPALAREIREKLLAMKHGDVSLMRQAYLSAETYQGPYTPDAPDLIVGFASGYRVSSESAVLKVRTPVIHDNDEPWQADHCVDREEVPGIFLSSVPVVGEPGIEDMAPTAAAAFGLTVPAHMDGRNLLENKK